jgi:hypothetical protein
METGSGLAILGSALGGAKLLEKLLGPTADYLGEGLRDWTRKRVENVSRIFKIAKESLGDRINKPGLVSPKVLRKVLDDGSYCDNELSAEYFGGVLASSRSSVDRDDRAVTFLNLTVSLSTYQIRAHYLLYTVLKRLFHGSRLRPTTPQFLSAMAILIPYQDYNKAMQFHPPEKGGQILVHITNGLFAAGLVGRHFFGGHKTVGKFLKTEYNVSKFPLPWSSMVAEPTSLGFEYYLWAHGRGDVPFQRFIFNIFEPQEVAGVPVMHNVLRVSDLPIKRRQAHKRMPNRIS